MSERFDVEVVLWGYTQGLFPMADARGRIGWYSPDPRAIIPLNAFHVPRTLRQLCRQNRFEVRVNTQFEAVMRACADRPDGTWISPRIIKVYCDLHRAGFAHSVESWSGGELVGGLYGVAIGGFFAGESMFHRARDASKVALVHLVERLRERGFRVLDIQYMTGHLARFGAVEIPGSRYLALLRDAVGARCGFVD